MIQTSIVAVSDRNIVSGLIWLDTVYNNKNSGRARENISKPVHALVQTFETLDFEGLPPSPMSLVQLVPAAVSARVRSKTYIFNHMQRMVAQEVDRK